MISQLNSTTHCMLMLECNILSDFICNDQPYCSLCVAVLRQNGFHCSPVVELPLCLSIILYTCDKNMLYLGVAYLLHL